MNRMLWIKTLMWVVIAVLVFFLAKSIVTPLLIRKEIEKRKEAVIKRLKDIRTAQLIFKAVNGEYADDFDKLISFVSKGRIPIVRLIHDPSDSTFTRTISDTVRFIPVSDSIFPGAVAGHADSLRFIPYSGGITFEIAATTIEKSGVQVSVFEVSAANKDFLQGINERYYDPYGGLSVGSLSDPSTSGNWE